MATDMEAVIARLAYHVDAIPEMKCHCDCLFTDDFTAILTVLQAAKAYVDAEREPCPAPMEDPEKYLAVMERRANASSEFFGLFEDSGVRAMKGETL